MWIREHVDSVVVSCPRLAGSRTRAEAARGRQRRIVVRWKVAESVLDGGSPTWRARSPLEDGLAILSRVLEATSRGACDRQIAARCGRPTGALIRALGPRNRHMTAKLGSTERNGLQSRYSKAADLQGFQESRRGDSNP